MGLAIGPLSRCVFGQRGSQLQSRGRDQLQAKLTTESLRTRFANVLDPTTKDGFLNGLRDSNRAFDVQRLGQALRQSQSNAQRIFATELDYSMPFRWSLEMDLNVLEQFKTSATENRFLTLNVIEDVFSTSTDLRLKASYLEKLRTDVVEVTVHTRKGGRPVPDCQVYYAPRMHQSESIKFDKDSTPTTDRVSPGSWLLWARKDGTDGVKERFDCGDDGEPKRVVHVQAP
jgi:hypothetical protein